MQSLLRRVHVRPADDLSRAFPEEHACRLAVRLLDGRVLRVEKRDYEGFHTRPATWRSTVEKLRVLAGEGTEEIADAIAHLDEIGVKTLTTLLETWR